MPHVVGMRAPVEMLRCTVTMGFRNVLRRDAALMDVQPGRLLKSRQNSKAQNCSERRAHHT